MADERTIASGIRYTEHLAVFDDIWRDRLAALDLSTMLVYMVDIVPADALIWLAKQFGVMGNEGWAFTSTDADRRELVKSAVELHRRKGTPFAIKTSIERASTISYADITITEGNINPLWYYDGSVLMNGSHLHGYGAHWTEFSVTIATGGTGGPFTAALYELLYAIIQEYKPARSTLLHVGMGVALDDSVGVLTEDLLLTPVFAFDEELEFGLFYDGSWNTDGTLQYDTDHLTLTII